MVEDVDVSSSKDEEDLEDRELEIEELAEFTLLDRPAPPNGPARVEE